MKRLGRPWAWRSALGRRARYSEDGQSLRVSVSYWFVGLPVLIMVVVLPLHQSLDWDSPVKATAQVIALAIFGVIGVALLSRSTFTLDRRSGRWRNELWWLVVPLSRQHGDLDRIEHAIFKTRDSTAFEEGTVSHQLSLRLPGKDIEIGPLAGAPDAARDEARGFAVFIGRPLRSLYRRSGQAWEDRGLEDVAQLEAALAELEAQKLAPRLPSLRPAINVDFSALALELVVTAAFLAAPYLVIPLLARLPILIAEELLGFPDDFLWEYEKAAPLILAIGITLALTLLRAAQFRRASAISDPTPERLRHVFRLALCALIVLYAIAGVGAYNSHRLSIGADFPIRIMLSHAAVDFLVALVLVPITLWARINPFKPEQFPLEQDFQPEAPRTSLSTDEIRPIDPKGLGSHGRKKY